MGELSNHLAAITLQPSLSLTVHNIERNICWCRFQPEAKSACNFNAVCFSFRSTDDKLIEDVFKFYI